MLEKAMILKFVIPTGWIGLFGTGLWKKSLCVNHAGQIYLILAFDERDHSTDMVFWNDLTRRRTRLRLIYSMLLRLFFRWWMIPLSDDEVLGRSYVSIIRKHLTWGQLYFVWFLSLFYIYAFGQLYLSMILYFSSFFFFHPPQA